MKKIYIENYNGEITKLYLLDLERRIQFLGSRKIEEYYESINTDLINKSFPISEEKFNELLKLKFLNIIKISYNDFLKKYELHEILI